MHIVFCSDNNLIKQTIVLVTSILHTNPDEQIDFFALLLNVEEKNVALLQAAISNAASLTVYTLSQKDVTHLPMHMSYITLGTYLRLFIERKLPQTIDKVLYLDCDTIVAGNLQEFYNTDISPYSLAAALDVEYADIRRYNRLDYPQAEKYFNAGVLLINLNYWRQNQVSKKALQYLEQYPERCLFHDQDALNHVLHGTVCFVSNKFNTLCDFFNTHTETMLIEKAELAQIKKELACPVIIHYAGNFKPWHLEYGKYHYPFGSIWLAYRTISNITLPLTHYKRKTKKTVKYYIKQALSRFKLAKSDIALLVKQYEDTTEIEKKLLHKLGMQHA